MSRCWILVLVLAQAIPWQTARPIDAVAVAGADAVAPLFVIGVPASLLDSVHQAITDRFGTPALASSISVDDREALDDALEGGTRALIALGRDACAALLLARPGRPMLCALLYADAFSELDCGDMCEHVEAIVLDQPPERQARVATSLFPALERFGVLLDSPQALVASAIRSLVFDPAGRLSSQLSELLVHVDAVIVEPRPDIYPPSSLRTVLLTAYGRDRPIVGYGPDWVRAGALVSAWSSPNDVLSDVQELLQLQQRDGTRARRVHPPRRFHVIENPAVARSLGLRRAPFDTGVRQFVDEDFLP